MKLKLCGEVLESTGGFEMEKTIQQIEDEVAKAFANIDIDAINAIVAPHGRKMFNSHEEFMSQMTERAIQTAKENFSRQKAFEEEE
jgi:hypothetical protein